LNQKKKFAAAKTMFISDSDKEKAFLSNLFEKMTTKDVERNGAVRFLFKKKYSYISGWKI
jgi:hypothetical protein